jgi:beta-phosphoglucomutase
MVKHAIQAVIWDLDGVIIDSAEEHRRAWQKLAQEIGKTMSDEEFRATFGMRNDTIISTLWGAMPSERIRELSERKEAYFRELIGKEARALPGALELMSQLHEAGFAQALASSTPQANIDLISEVLGLRRYLQVLVSGETVERGKPAPDIFLKAAAGLQVTPEACVVIEDAPAGVEAAHAAGMRCIAVAGTRDPALLREADLVVRSLSELSVEQVRALGDRP